VCEPLLQAFPFPSTLGEVTLHMLSQDCVFVYSSHGRWVVYSLLWSFPPSTILTSFPAPGYWVHAWLPPEPLWPTWLVYSLFLSGKDSLPPIFDAQCTPPSFLCVFMFLLLIVQFLFFPLVGVGLPRRLCCSGPGLSWEYCVLISSPCPHFPKTSEQGRLAAWGTSWLPHLM
jgi:hypothetical protein